MAAAPRVLITVSGSIPSTLADDVTAGRRPRADYVELARALGADLIDHDAARVQTGRVGRLVERVGGRNVLLAYACFRRRRAYDAILTDGEQVGLPYAAMCRLVPRRRLPVHSMIVHILSVPKKVLVWRALRLGGRIDGLFTYASTQQRFAVDRLGMAVDAVVLTSFMVDTEFFAPARVEAAPRQRPLVCAAGLEFRDYDTLVDAVTGADLDVVIAAASPWSKRPTMVGATALPDNVEVTKLDFVRLRQLYADATVVVMPLHDVAFQAGITTILEAMSMAKAVVCTRTEGQTDAVVDGETGWYVPPGDVPALRAAIERLVADEPLRGKLGDAARTWACSTADVGPYSRRLADEVRRLVATRALGGR